MKESGRKSDFVLTTFDDIFSTQEMRDGVEEGKTDVYDIPLELLDSFEGHPYKVVDDESMTQLADSIAEHGVITPAVVRRKDNGRYELISGHRRKRASELAGLDALRCEIVDVSREEAIIRMVESNFYRESVLPSEKAFAYKMRFDAMKRQGERTDLTSCQLGTKSRTDAKLESEFGESARQIQRYICLTRLIPELLERVDAGEVKLNPAVELSYLNEKEQKTVDDEIGTTGCAPSHAQSIRMKDLSRNGELTKEKIEDIMCEKKPNQKQKVSVSFDKIRSVAPKNVKDNELEDFVYKAVECYTKVLRKRAEQQR